MEQARVYRVLGTMSGTSLDGLDLALCTFRYDDGWRYTIEKCRTVPFDDDMEMVLHSAHMLNGLELTRLDRRFAQFTAEAVDGFLLDTPDSEKPELIVSHGQTVFHVPSEDFTLQIGSPAVIAALTGIPTLGDVRSADMALGGQGAPLVPVGDELLFPQYGACVNFGGFANLSLKKGDKRVAWDSCPMNYVLNHLAREAGFAYDDAGELARSGELDRKLLKRLESLEFYKRPAPKSLGREWVEAHMLPLIDDEEIPVTDRMRTLTEHIALRLAADLGKVEGAVLLTGGGAHNTFLLERLKALSSAELVVADDILLEFKEALIFAFLGVLYLRDEPNVWASVTGASRDSIGGQLAK